MFEEQRDKYLFRRQYLLAPCGIDSCETWRRIKVSKDYVLNAHPDLLITEAHCVNRSIYLLGYIIDPYNPTYDDLQIIQNVIDKSKTADDVFENIADKCGRFVIIVRVENEFRIFSDPCGLRQVFYHIDERNYIWCSSQPHLISEQLGIEVKEEVKSDLHKSHLFKTTEHWYPGKITLFDGIFHLTPNHYLNINLKKVYRYWPKEVLSPMPILECVPKVSRLLSGIIEGAVTRFNIAFAISCGRDSRTLLATSRKVAKNIHYFTQTSSTSIDSNPDVIIPSLMLKQLGLKHSVLVLPENLDESFKTILERNVFTARTIKGLNAISIYDHFKNDKKEVVVLYGNCSEITKRDRFRFPKTPKSLLRGTALSAMAEMSHSQIAKNEFNNWLMSVKKLTKYNIDILDLMHWEQRVGNWGAMTFSEYEMVFESLCPYSCRRYIEYMLRVPFKYRTSPEYKLHHDIINANWPELLEYEINPEINWIKKKINNLLYKTNLYDPIKYAHIMLYKRLK